VVCCVLAANKKRTRFILQLYLSHKDINDQDNTKSVRRFIRNELFKSDMYGTLTLRRKNEQNHFKPCFVVSIRDFLQNEFSLNTKDNSGSGSSLEKDLYICESMYSTVGKYFRKFPHTKKWQPLKFLGKSMTQVEQLATTTTNAMDDASTSANEESEKQTPNSQLVIKKRNIDDASRMILVRSFLDESLVKSLKERVDKKMDANGKFVPVFFKPSYCDTVQYDTPPAR
jgi:hypothetical protein